jgi:hypothetical protein
MEKRQSARALQQRIQSKRDISNTQILQVTLATVNRDVSYLRDEAKHNIKMSEDKDLLEEEQEEKAGEITTAITNQVF